MVEVRIFATFREGRQKVYQYDDIDLCVFDYVDRLGIDREEVAIVLINGFHQSLTTVVHDGDILSLFPATGGG